MPKASIPAPAEVVLANGVRIGLCVRESFEGLGAITLDGVALRSARRPMFVEIRNPDGIELCAWRLTGMHQDAAGATLSFGMDRREGGLLEWMVHTVRSRRSTVDWTERPTPADDTILELVLRPLTREIGGRAWRGFSYQYRYRSVGIPIYRILDRGTWEIGGSAVGNELWSRSCFTPSIQRIDSVAQHHSSEWYLPGCANPSVVQFLPWQTELQGFTFASADAGTLITWANEVAHIRTLLEKPRGTDEVVHWHEHCGDLASTFTTAPVEVLFAAGALDAVGRANAYESVKELVHTALHAQIGMQRERAVPYGQIEEWGPADLERYRTAGLPKLLAAGVRTVYIANHFQNNMNTWGVSNMCCTVDYRVAESVGEDKLAAFCRDAHAAGAKVEMWGNTSISTLTWILDQRNGNTDRIRFLPREGTIMDVLSKAKAPFVRNPSNAIEADHYTPIFAVLNLRDPVVRGYWIERWQAAHDQVGLDGIFLDSSFNLSSDKFHWVQLADAGLAGATADQTHLLGRYRPVQEPRKEILSQYRAHLDLMTAMQRFGVGYTSEDLGVFGVHRHGPDVTARLDSLPIWSECLCGFDVPALRKVGADLEDVFFRGLAYRMVWCLHWSIADDALSLNYGGIRCDDDRPTAWQLQMLRVFGEVGSAMRERRILPDGRAVLYHGDGRRILWVFEEMDYDLDVPAEDLVGGGTLPAGRQRLARRHVYRLSGAG